MTKFKGLERKKASWFGMKDLHRREAIGAIEAGGAVRGRFSLALYVNFTSRTYDFLPVCLRTSGFPQVQFFDKCLKRNISKREVIEAMWISSLENETIW